MISPRYTRPTLIAAALVALLVLPSPALANDDDTAYSEMCQRHVSVDQWTPKSGPIARYIADTYAKSTETGVWIGLGRSGNSFWSAEGGDVNDACDDCRSLYLVETRADGTRKQHVIIGPNEWSSVSAEPEARKAYILARLWKLAASTWPADKLTQDYALTRGRRDADKAAIPPTFAVKIVAKNVFDLQYDFSVSTHMCWCVFKWNAQSRR